MSEPNPVEQPKLIDFAAERDKRAHSLKEKRLEEVRRAFEAAMPLKSSKKKKPKGKPKKR